ncbi:hypothetical protein AB0K51_16365 [Kitasatospora sp. NPDC049285]|uniref:hypothetical protein n=1 Tax=Kitasatospora sp. NPDC049285 TaxID=3157096 RepID=UPI00341A5EB4
MPARLRSALLGTALAAVVAANAWPAAAATAYGPLPPQNPATAPNGTAGMHGDSASSDTTPYPGPGTAPVDWSRTALASACPTVVVGADGLPVALCTSIFGQNPTVYLLDPGDGHKLAELGVPKGALFGGVYAYLDQHDALVLVDGAHDLLRIGHHRTAQGWQLTTDQSTSLRGAIPDGDDVVGLSPGWDGKVWFATGGGLVGTVDTDTGAVRTLATGEGVANSISTVPGHTAVATDHALYLFGQAADGTPVVQWRAAYDRGPGRKPGQLSWGTGATPSFFGPGDGTEYVTITDNAAPHENLLVYRVDGGPVPVCAVPVLTRKAASGTEDAVIASGRSVFVTNTYGYPYPALPAGAPASVPASASFEGGLARVDLDASGTGCHPVWESDAKSAALPRLSVADGKIYTVTVSGPTDSVGAQTFATYAHAVLDPETGARVAGSAFGIGLLYNPLQMTGTTAPDGTLYQGTETGVLRITRR